jgi:hypothetical protein
MPNFDSNALLNDLKSCVDRIESDFDSLLESNDLTHLQYATAENKWSAIECIEHLNMTGRYYLPKMEEALEKGIAKGISSKSVFKSGFMGNYMYNSMKPKSGEIQNKVGTFKSINPQVKYKKATMDANKVCENFRMQLNTFRELLDKAAQTDINKLKVPSLLGPILMLKLGDVFRFLLAHIDRHLIQAKNAIPATVA